MVKFNKDLIQCRAAINTLRSHSEETAESIDEIRKITDNVREDTGAMDKRIKKIVVFIQNETKDINGQLKDVMVSIDRNANRIEELANRKPPEPRVVRAPPDQNSRPGAPSDEREPRVATPTTPVTNRATSPHAKRDDMVYVSATVPVQPEVG